MNRILYILTTVMLLLTGCVKETADSLDVHDYNMTVRLPAPSLDDEKHQEAKIKTVQLIMVQGGEVRYDHYYTDVEYAAGYTYTINDKVKLPLGDYDVYVICNLNKVENTGANFPEAAIVEIPGMIYAKTDEFRIPMYGKTTCEVEADKPLSIVFDDKVPLERLMSKITLDFKADGDFAGMKITNISIKQFCSSVQLGVSQTPASPSAGSALEHTMPTDAPLVLPAKYPTTFYIPETYVDPGSPVKPYVEVSAIINNAKTGGKDLKTKYKLEIETNTPNAADKSYVRNTQYDITATVKGYGNADDMFVKVNVLPWNMSSTSGSDGIDGYVKFLRATFTPDDGTERALPDAGNISEEAAGNVKIVCETTVGGWYMVVYEDGKLIMNTKSTPTDAVEGVKTEQFFEIPIAAMGYTKRTFTVNTYHHVLAPELIGPFKLFGFKQFREGFIPNPVLIAAGWPTAQLPEHGLQIAKRGNKVLPSGVATADDPNHWIWSQETLRHGTSPALGMGVSNTNKTSEDTYSAAYYCRNSMGEQGWFLPSDEEMRLILANHGSLGSSYSFNSTWNIFYWTSTEDQNSSTMLTDARVVSFNDGYPGMGGRYPKNPKTNQDRLRIRCAKKI